VEGRVPPLQQSAPFPLRRALGLPQHIDQLMVMDASGVVEVPPIEVIGDHPVKDRRSKARAPGEAKSERKRSQARRAYGRQSHIDTRQFLLQDRTVRATCSRAGAACFRAKLPRPPSPAPCATDIVAACPSAVPAGPSPR